MRKRASAKPRLVITEGGSSSTVLTLRNVAEGELWLCARPFHTAAKRLAGALEGDPGPVSDFEACPVVFMYRRAIELHLKALVLGEGGNFLATEPDRLSIYKTHSVSWLAQFVCQIVVALKWEREFRCEGVESLADFKAIIEEINAAEAGYALRCPGKTDPSQAGFSVREFARRLDAILELLDSTAAGLAAAWNMQTGTAAPEADFDRGDDFEPTIH